VLARLAENLFWAGRYIERAEDTARMVDVTYHTQLESPYGEVELAWQQLLDVLHLRAAYGAPIEPLTVMRFLVLDADHPGSITASVTRARENIRSVRELVSTELWEAVNDLHLALDARDLGRELSEQPFELFRTVRRMSMTIYGVASETMPRDEGWRFMALGRLLERAEMTCRLIDVRYAQLEAMSGPSQRLAQASGLQPFANRLGTQGQHARVDLGAPVEQPVPAVLPTQREGRRRRLLRVVVVAFDADAHEIDLRLLRIGGQGAASQEASVVAIRDLADPRALGCDRRDESIERILEGLAVAPDAGDERLDERSATVSAGEVRDVGDHVVDGIGDRRRLEVVHLVMVSAAHAVRLLAHATCP